EHSTVAQLRGPVGRRCELSCEQIKTELSVDIRADPWLFFELRSSALIRFQVLFRSITRALSATPLRSSCSLRGKASTFHTYRELLRGRFAMPRKLRSI